MTTPLFKEALLEAKRLREAAAEEAKQAVLERVSPMIKQMLDKEIAGANIGNLFMEADEPIDPALMATPDQNATTPTGTTPTGTTPAPVPGSAPVLTPTDVVPPTDVTAAPTDATVTPTDAKLDPPMGDTAVAPVTPTGGLMDIPIDPNGKITVDLEQLFSSSQEETTTMPTAPEGNSPVVPVEPTPAAVPPGAEMPAETPVEPQGMAPEALPQDLSGTPPLQEATHAFFKKEVSLLENSLTANSLNNLAKEAYKTKIFSLYEMLEVLRENKGINPMIASLEEGRLEVLYGKLTETLKEHNSYRHPQKEVETMKKQTLKEFAASLFEEEDKTENLGNGGAVKADGFGAEKAKKEINNKSTASDEHAKKAGTQSGEVKDPGKEKALKHGGAAGFTNLDEAEITALENELREMLEGEDLTEEEELSECGGMSESPVNVNITIDTGDDDDVSVSSHGLGMDDDEEVDLDMSGEDESDDEDEELEIVDDADEDMSSGADEEEEVEEEEEEEEEPVKPLAESRKVVAENVALKKQLNETQMLMTRSLYVNKLFARENLSNEQKRKIVEYLDSARTIQEAKAVYGRIKTILDTAVIAESKKTPKAGRASATTTSGGSRLINESVGNLAFDTNRWAQLAGISKKST